ncbi:unnamed protein product [Symbiodinium microadriaticum]|nr:unnamed protein product [Symbiodinium microadriaticum]
MAYASSLGRPWTPSRQTPRARRMTGWVELRNGLGPAQEIFPAYLDKDTKAEGLWGHRPLSGHPFHNVCPGGQFLAHPPNSGRYSPDMQSETVASYYSATRFKKPDLAVQFTRMCKFWQTNECKMGADCTFAHDSSDLRPSRKPCFDFAKKGVCTRGDACRFVHQLGPKAKVNVTEMHNATFQMIRPDIPSQLLAAYTMPMQSLDAPGKFALNSGAAPWCPWESDTVLNQFPQAPPGLDQIPLPKSLIGGAACMVDNNNKDEADVCSTSSGDSSLGFQGGL